MRNMYTPWFLKKKSKNKKQVSNILNYNVAIDAPVETHNMQARKQQQKLIAHLRFINSFPFVGNFVSYNWPNVLNHHVVLKRQDFFLIIYYQIH